MESSRFIIEANRRGTNPGVYYFLGSFISLLIGQFVGAIPLVAVLVLKGRLDMVALTDPAALGVSNNFFFALMMFPFICSMVLLLLFVKLVHKRPARTLVTPRPRIDWGKFLIGFGLWIVLLSVIEGTNYILNPDNYIMQFQPGKFFVLLLLSVPLLLIQTAYEEVLFRGYLMQWLGKYSPFRIVPVLITGVAFGLMHMMNPEMGEFGWTVMIDYIAIGLALGIVTILSDSLELAMGLHFANNLFLSLFVTFDASVLKTDAVFRIKEMQINTSTQLLSILMLIVFIWLASRFYPMKPLRFLFQRDPVNIDQ